MKQPSMRWGAWSLAAIFFLFLPTWLWLGEAWTSDPYYSHGPLVLVVALYFFWVRRTSLAADATPSNWGWLVLIAALGVHLWATWWRAYYISALAIPFTLFGLLLILRGWRTARGFIFPLAFLIFMVPLPLAERFGPMLEGWTAASATAFAQRLGVPATNDGSQVFLPNSTFSVGLPCGGLSSAISILTLATLFAFVVRGPIWSRGVIILAAIPIALAANTLRISLIFAIAANWGAEVALDYFHSWSSPVLFLSAFALLIAMASLLRCSSVRWEAILPS